MAKEEFYSLSEKVRIMRGYFEESQREFAKRINSCQGVVSLIESGYVPKVGDLVTDIESLWQKYKFMSI